MDIGQIHLNSITDARTVSFSTYRISDPGFRNQDRDLQPFLTIEAIYYVNNELLVKLYRADGINGTEERIQTDM